uniref:Uncharacterized protein n=1 Tax=Cucumis melo TaxID=3656 RepID=A0A9I9E5Y3_CUCME
MEESFRLAFWHIRQRNNNPCRNLLYTEAQIILLPLMPEMFVIISHNQHPILHKFPFKTRTQH